MGGAAVRIWVDADACPKVIKEILYRAAQRTGTLTTLVANQPLSVPKSPYLQSRLVATGFDVADNEIARCARAGDLIVTGDIPLAAQVIEQGCVALSPRGELYTPENIRPRLNMRDFMDSLRASGVDTGGPAPLSQSQRREFGNQLDRFLAAAG